MTLDVLRFGVTLGCVWSLCILVLVLASWRSQKADAIMQWFSKVYRGFQKTFVGVLIGAAWGFVDGTLSGLLIAWIYNKIVA